MGLSAKIVVVLSKSFTVAAVAGLLASCGGGGGGDDDSETSVSGTAATGRPLPGASIGLTCANRRTLSAISEATGKYLTGRAQIRLPCLGQAERQVVSFNGVLFTGNAANFTPLTHLLVEAMLASASAGGAVMTKAEFLALIQTDATFARNVSDPRLVRGYRNAVITALRRLLAEAGRDPELAEILRNENFEEALFSADGRDAIDTFLDAVRDILLNGDGSFRAAVIALIRAIGNELEFPGRDPTGSTGATGGAGGGGTGNN